MAEDQQSPVPTNPTGYSGLSEAINHLSNIARQLSVWSQSITNSTPAATTTGSPRFTGASLGTASPTVVIAASTTRHGIIFHNVGGTASVYLYQTGMTTVPTSTSLGGSILILPGATLEMPSTVYPNINAGFSAFTNTGSSQPFTVVEFF